jgi:hypothetical protein
MGWEMEEIKKLAQCLKGTGDELTNFASQNLTVFPTIVN